MKNLFLNFIKDFLTLFLKSKTKNNLNDWFVFLDKDYLRKNLPQKELDQMTSDNKEYFGKLIMAIKYDLNPILEVNGIPKITPDLVNSSFRCKERNEKVQGSKKSNHYLKAAFDIHDPNLEITNFVLNNKNQLKNINIDFIVGYKNFIHLQPSGLFSDKSKKVYCNKEKQFIY